MQAAATVPVVFPVKPICCRLMPKESTYFQLTTEGKHVNSNITEKRGARYLKQIFGEFCT